MEDFKEEAGDIFLHKPSNVIGVFHSDENDRFMMVSFVPDRTRKIKYAPEMCPEFHLDEHKDLLLEFYR